MVFTVVVLYCAIFPALYFVGPELSWFTKGEISYAAVMYYVVFNTLLIVGLGYCIVGCVAYPFSASFFRNSHKRSTNQRFGTEFVKCTERVSRVLQDMIQMQSSENTSAILSAPLEDEILATEEVEQAANSVVQLNQKEIYSRVASNIELVSLYLMINQKIIDEVGATRQSQLFLRVTALLNQIKQTLDRVELRLNFVHSWFPQGKFVSFWAFYNHLNAM